MSWRFRPTLPLTGGSDYVGLCPGVMSANHSNVYSSYAYARALINLDQALFYPRWLCRSACVGNTFEAVCLFVCPQHNSETNDPKVFKPWDILEVTWFWGLKIKVRVTVMVQQYGVGSNSISVFWFILYRNCFQLQHVYASDLRGHCTVVTKLCTLSSLCRTSHSRAHCTV